MILSCLSEEELRNRDTHEASRTRGRYNIGSVEESGDKTENMARMFQLRRTTSRS